MSLILLFAFILSLGVHANEGTHTSELDNSGIIDVREPIPASKNLSPYAECALLLLHDVRESTLKTDEGKITKTVDLFIHVLEDQMLSYTFDDIDLDIFFNPNSQHADSLSFTKERSQFRKELWKANGLPLVWSEIDLSFDSIAIDGETAEVLVREVLQYILDTEIRQISSVQLNYEITLSKLNDVWMIDRVTTDDEITRFFDKESIGASIERLKAGTPIVIRTSAPPRRQYSVDSLDSGWEYITLNTSRFREYALEYSSNTTGSSSYNPLFFDCSDYGGDCQNFASQCLWYGFGGNNTASDIAARRWPMISSGPRAWFLQGTTFNCDSAHAWISVEAFKTYAAAGGYHIAGPDGYVFDGVAYAQVGDIIQVDYTSDGVFDHSYVVTAVSGTEGSRGLQNISVCAHTTNRNSVLLSNIPYSSASFRTLRVDATWKES